MCIGGGCWYCVPIFIKEKSDVKVLREREERRELLFIFDSTGVYMSGQRLTPDWPDSCMHVPHSYKAVHLRLYMHYLGNL